MANGALLSGGERKKESEGERERQEVTERQRHQNSCLIIKSSDTPPTLCKAGLTNLCLNYIDIHNRFPQRGDQGEEEE